MHISASTFMVTYLHQYSAVVQKMHYICCKPSTIMKENMPKLHLLMMLSMTNLVSKSADLKHILVGRIDVWNNINNNINNTFFFIKYLWPKSDRCDILNQGFGSITFYLVEPDHLDTDPPNQIKYKFKGQKMHWKRFWW